MKGLLVIAGLLLLGTVSAVALPAYVDVLPAAAPYDCLNCHATREAPSAADLTPFGEDFRDNGLAWNEYLAGLDSDGDGCNNGIEVGDADGDGQLDQGVTAESSNPGVPGDCTAEIPDITWGRLKVMFNGQK